jgi:CheY-like chemotaxis protein
MERRSMTTNGRAGTKIVEWEGRDYILIVEDDNEVSDALTELLQDDGHRVVSFQDGRLALDYLRQKSVLPRLIFLDFLMPQMDGWQFLAERRKDARIAQVPVVGISGSEVVDERSLLPNVMQLLKKPVSIEALLGAVRRCAPTSFGV